MTKIFVIVDESNLVWGIAPTLTQAKRQVSWFLPKNTVYNIKMDWIC